MDVFGTSFLPNILYFQKMVSASNPVVDLGEHFVKQTYRNRTFILSSNGPLQLIVPIRKSDSLTGDKAGKKIGDMEISYAEDWQTKVLRAIRSSYTNSPYYEHYQVEFEELLVRKEKLLHVYNRNLLDWLLKELHIDITIVYSHSYLNEGVRNDYRDLDFYGVANQPKIVEYKQVFSYKMHFTPGLSVIDLLFNKGPEALVYIK